jgi:hypothetical protein
LKSSACRNRTHETIDPLRMDRRLKRPISARFPARLKVVIGGAPMTLFSHRGDPNARGATDAARLLQSRFTRRSKSVSNEKRIMLSVAADGHITINIGRLTSAIRKNGFRSAKLQRSRVLVHDGAPKGAESLDLIERHIWKRSSQRLSAGGVALVRRSAHSRIPGAPACISSIDAKWF